jgi:hypothetical protein
MEEYTQHDAACLFCAQQAHLLQIGGRNRWEEKHRLRRVGSEPGTIGAVRSRRSTRRAGPYCRKG